MPNMFNEEFTDPRDFSLRHARKIGWFLLAAGLVLGLLSIALPIWQIKNGEKSVGISMAGASCAIIAICLAPGYIIGGRRFVELVWPPPGRWTLGSVLTLMATILVCVGVFIGFQQYLTANGYSL